MIKSLKHIIKAYWRGFAYGPDFNHCITPRFILEDKQLTIELPSSNVVAAPSTVDINFPHTSTSWFKQHKKIRIQHHYVHLITENWMYMPPIALLPSCEYGMLSCQLRIKQTEKINVLDKQALAAFLIQEYNDYNYGPKGENTKTRQWVTEQSSKRANPWSPDELEEKISYRIKYGSKPDIPPAIIKNINQTEWVFYQEIKKINKNQQDYYCLPLSRCSFLEVKFNHRVDLSNKHKKWAKHALSAQARIMDSIRLTDIPTSQDNLITQQSSSSELSPSPNDR